MSHAPWPNRSVSFALQPIFSACWPLCSSAAGSCSFQVFLPAFLVRQGWEIHSAVFGSVTQLPCLGRTRGPAPSSLHVFPIGLSGQEGPGATLSSVLDCDSAPLPGQGQTRLQGWQTSSFEDSNQADLHPAEFPIQTAPPAWFCRRAKPPVGITTWVLQVGTLCQDLSAGCHKPFPSLPSQSDSQWSSPTDSSAISMR